MRVGMTDGSFSVAVVVFDEIDRFLVDVGQNLMRDPSTFCTSV